MKKLILPLVLFTTVLQAQEVVFEIRSEMRKFSGGEAPAFVVDIPEVTLAEAEDAFQGKMKEYAKTKAEKNGHEIAYHQVIVPRLSENPIDIYGVFYEKAGAVTFVGFFYIDSAFVSDKSAERTYSTAYKFVKDYANKAYLLGLEHKLTGEKTGLSDMQKELKANHKEQERIQKSLIKANRQIEKSEMKIKELKTEVGLLTNEIGKRKEASISSNSDPEEKKQAKKDISDMEKKRSSLNKTIDKEYGLVTSSQASIRQLEMDLKDRQRVAEILTRKIAEQEQQVEGVKSKMSEVKK